MDRGKEFFFTQKQWYKSFIHFKLIKISQIFNNNNKNGVVV